MSRTRTLTDMLLDVRQRTNHEESTFVTDAELTEYLNQSLADLWTRLIQCQGQPLYRSSTTYTVTSSTSLQALPADFFAVQEVTATIGGFSGALTPFMAAERGYLRNAAVWNPMCGVQYRCQAGNIEFLPASQSFTATLFYSPTQPRLTAGSDTFDGFGGWEMAAIYDVCAIVAAKEETDPGFHISQRERIYKQIETMAAQRDAANPERVQEVIGSDGGWFG